MQTIFSQEVKNEPQKPYLIGKPSKVEYVSSIASRINNLVRPDLQQQKEMLDGRSSKYDVVIGKGSEGDDPLAKYSDNLRNSIPSRTPELVFETGASNSNPTDPSGAVGPNHYISVINTAFQIFDKSGASLTGGLVSPNPTIFPSGGCCDLTASYDNVADRWILSFLGGGVQVAVSDGPDPVNDSWTVYSYSAVSDYQKLSVWRDGYYMTENTGSANKLHVFQRDAMIDAASEGTEPQILSFSLPGLVTSGFHSPQVLNISNDNWPTTGGATVMYMQDDAWSGIDTDHVKLWNVDIDWETPGDSEVSAAVELSTTEFVSVFDGGSFSNLPQPNGGATVDALQATIMNQAQYRKFATYNSALFNFVIDVDGSSTKQAGVRWYELRQTADGEPWEIYQEGTYTAPDNRHAWNASLIMDVQGNIGMGYTGMSSANSTDDSVLLGSYYTGRYSGDPINVMTIDEGTIMAGDANIFSTRYGDYSKIDVDPANDKKFWFVNEVMSNGRKNIAGVFQIAANAANDVAVISLDTPVTGILTSTETITVTIRNFGENSATGFDVSYQVNSGTVITETFTETIASNESVQFTFTTPVDLSSEGQVYSILSSVTLTGDEDSSNDSITTEITHVYSNDIGVTAITGPDDGEALTNESVVVTIENFGTATQSNFQASYSINGAPSVSENVAGPLDAGTSISYTFSTLGNFSMDGTYTVVAETLLASDSDMTNNSFQREVLNSACYTRINDTENTIGPDIGVTTSIINMDQNAVITDVNLTLNIAHTWDADLEVKLIAPDGVTEIILFEDIGSNGDNFTNTVLDDDASTVISDGEAPFTGSFSPTGSLSDLNGLLSGGDWTLYINDDADGDGGTLLDWSIQICTEASLSVSDNKLDGEFKIFNKGNNQFEVSLANTSSFNDLDLNVYNMVGQTLLWKTIKNTSGFYSYTIDMSRASTGVYLVRLGNNSNATIKRIVVE
ncbi:proprotein convertase P-domain-containing protein [bacterium]|nr:proprotein convertase P-domain-containing protein [bacterium]MDA9327758.1 proprotein convertase P-domain-containing protein [Flavobacteriaceae bacterium]